MQLIGENGRGISLQVCGYQFPDAVDPRQRYSWHMVEGAAHTEEGEWSFRWQALTCNESPLMSQWLLSAAAGQVQVSADEAGGFEQPGALTFTEPNLAFAVEERTEARVVLRVGLDLEFRPPWRRSRYAGHPVFVRCVLTPQQLRAAARQWDEEWSPYPG